MVCWVRISRPMESPDRSPIPRYAAEVAPEIDRVHAGFHQRAAAAFRQSGLERPPHAGFLISLRFALADLSRPLPLSVVKLAFRYSAPEDVAAAVAELAEADWLHLDGELVQPARRTVSWISGLYDVHAEVAAAAWEPVAPDLVAPDLVAPAALAGRLLTAATETPGPVLAALCPPYERAGDPPGVVLFNRLAVFRYHRADAHAAAWAAEGLTAQEMQALRPGELRDRIEAETNRLAAPPFETLTGTERRTFLDGLRALPG
jgi:hypothetical protein